MLQDARTGPLLEPFANSHHTQGVFVHNRGEMLTYLTGDSWQSVFVHPPAKMLAYLIRDIWKEVFAQNRVQLLT